MLIVYVIFDGMQPEWVSVAELAKIAQLFEMSIAPLCL